MEGMIEIDDKHNNFSNFTTIYVVDFSISSSSVRFGYKVKKDRSEKKTEKPINVVITGLPYRAK